MIRENGDRIGSVREVDFYVNGNVKIPKDSLIVSPQIETDRCQMENDDISVVSYEGKDVREYIEQIKLFRKLGYIEQVIGDKYWIHAEKEQLEYKNTMKAKGYTNTGLHSASIEQRREAVETFAELIKSLQNIIERGDYLDNKETALRLIEPLEKSITNTGINIGLHDASLEAILNTDNAIHTNYLRQFGLESFMINMYNQNREEQVIAERLIENMYIDKFLKQYSDVAIVQEESAVEMDIKKANVIYELINNGEFERKEQGEECFEILIKHICKDLRFYKKYCESNKENWIQREENLDGMLEPLGLDCETVGLQNSHFFENPVTTRVMEKIEENKNIKYAPQLRKLDKMIRARIGMKLAGIEDSRFEQHYTEFIQELSGKINKEYLIDLTKKGMMSKLDEYLSGNFDYTIFTEPVANRSGFQGLKAEIDDRIGLIEKAVSSYDEDERRQNIEYFKGFYNQEVSKAQYRKEEKKGVRGFYEQVEENENLYTTNAMGKSTVYANPEIKLGIGNEIKRGIELEEILQGESEIEAE